MVRLKNCLFTSCFTTGHKNHSIEPAKGFAKSRDIAEKYDQTANGGHYDVRYKEEQEKKYEALLQLLISDLSKVVGHRFDLDELFMGLILDSGCGTAMLFDFLRDQCNSTGVGYVGIDISLEMLRAGHTKLKGKGGDLVQATAELIPIRSGSMDCIFSVSTFQNLDDRQQEAYFQEIARVGRSNQHVFLFSFLDKPPLSERVDDIIASLDRYFRHVVIAPKRRDIEDQILACSN
jgi:ubiquinone/menaquinone biosynthesis C-methylase UbiE